MPQACATFSTVQWVVGQEVTFGSALEFGRRDVAEDGQAVHGLFQRNLPATQGRRILAGGVKLS